MNINYETVCKYIGQLYLESQVKISSLEEQCQRLLLVNKELEAKNVKENVDGLSKERTNS